MRIGTKPVLSLLVAVLMLVTLLSPLAAVRAEAQAAGPGPASERIIWKRVPLERAVEALRTGEIDVYVFGLKPALAEELVGERNIKIYAAPSGLVDFILNPAPVMILEFEGEVSKAEAATRLGVNPIAITYIKYDKERDKTLVELAVKPETTGGATVVREANVDINPFAVSKARFAINYVVDREFIVDNIYRGFALPMYTFYGPADPTYTELVDLVAKYRFTYQPAYAKKLIDEVMTKLGAELRGGKWYFKGKPVVITGIIRVEDERRELGDMLVTELSKLGFTVTPQYLTFGEAITKVYATDPMDFEWFFYTEGWGRGALDRWDPWMLAQFAAPWFGWMPGWAVPEYWNYKNETIDFYSRNAALGNVTSKEQWIEFIRKGTELGIEESVRVWIAARMDVYAASAKLRGVTLDLGAGLRSPLGPREWYIPGKDTLTVGHLWVWTARTVWNPYGGFDDVYSVDPMRVTWDPFIWRHPFNGEPIPFRTPFEVETAGPEGKLPVPADAVWWDAETDSWVSAADLGRTSATSKVTFDLSRVIGTKWHHGVEITWADILAWIATLLDITYDPVKSQMEGAIAETNRPIFDTFVAFRVLEDEKKLEVYVNYWHFDPAYIADYVVLSIYNPAELLFAMNVLAFEAKKYAFDETRAKAEKIPQLNLVIAEHAVDVASTLEELAGRFEEFRGFFTVGDRTFMTEDEWRSRIEAAVRWIETHGHAWISDGPWMLESFDKDAQELVLVAFRDPTYPFKPRDWYFGEPITTTITNVFAPVVSPGEPATITITVAGVPPIHVKYLVRDPITGTVLASGTAELTPAGTYVVRLSAEDTAAFNEYSAYELTLIAYSEEVVLPYELVTALQTGAAVAARLGEVERAIGARISEVEEALSGLATQTAQLRELTDALREQLATLQERLGGLEVTLAESIRTMIDSLTALSDSLARFSETTSATLESIGETLATIGETLSRLEGRLGEASEGISGVRDEVATVKEAVDALSEDVGKLAGAASRAANLSLVNTILIIIAIALAGLALKRRS